MERLTLKELAPYLPYGLKIHCAIDNTIGNLFNLSKHQYSVRGKFDLKNGTDVREFVNIDFSDFITLASPNNFKPILRPLSDFNYKFIDALEQEGAFYADIIYDMETICLDFTDNSISKLNLLGEPLEVLDFLYKHHLDVFGLIEKGLAVNINTIK